MSNSECRTMRPVEVETLAERALWGERQRLLKDHNSYSVRNSYYPYRMDEWHEKEANICREYNKKISRLNRIRKEREKNNLKNIDIYKYKCKIFILDWCRSLSQLKECN